MRFLKKRFSPHSNPCALKGRETNIPTRRGYRFHREQLSLTVRMVSSPQRDDWIYWPMTINHLKYIILYQRHPRLFCSYIYFFLTSASSKKRKKVPSAKFLLDPLPRLYLSANRCNWAIFSKGMYIPFHPQHRIQVLYDLTGFTLNNKGCSIAHFTLAPLSMQKRMYDQVWERSPGLLQCQFLNFLQY
jgi:hypothetical protein